jgi:ribosomal protein S18 acetylase RimI-like enzyme
MKKLLEIKIKDRDDLKIIFRHVKKSDVDGVWNNFNEVLEEGIYLPVLSPVRSEWEKTSWFENIKKDNELCIVAENADLDNPHDVLGQCEISNLEWEAAIHVGSLGVIVKKEFRDLSIGRKLIDLAIRESKRLNHKEKIILSCFSSNKRGLHLYESMGFKRIGVRKNQYYLNSIYYDEVMMEISIEEYLRNPES